MRASSHALLLPALLLLLPALSGRARAADSADAGIGRAEAAYRAGDYALAARELRHVPGLLGVVPLLDEVKGGRRARVLFDLARCQFALGDTAAALAVLEDVFALAPGQRRGDLDVPRDDALDRTREALNDLQRRSLQAALASRSRVAAAFRSLVWPGWGQVYRGHRRQGRMLMGTAGALLAGWIAADRSYRSALNAYRLTSGADLHLADRTGTAADVNPFEQRFSRAKSRAFMASAALAGLAGLWAYGVTENLFVGPGRVRVAVPLP